MNKYVVLSLIMLSIGSAYGRYMHPEEMDIKNQINKLQRQINDEKRSLQRLDRSTKYKKEVTKYQKEAELQNIENRKASKEAAKRADIEERKQRINMLEEELSQLQQ